MKYDYVIWDFNGTLLDDVQTGIDSVNALLVEKGLPRIESIEKYRSVFRFPIIDYYRTLGFDFEKESFEELAPKWVALYLENVKSASLYGDAIRTLDFIRSHGIKQSVLSATEQSMLNGQLCDLGINGYFEEILGLDNIHALSKLRLANEWRERHPDSRVLFIGDTDHDVQTAELLLADCVLVARGHQPKAYLESLGVPVTDNFDGIVELIKQ